MKLNISAEMGASSIVIVCASPYTLEDENAMIGGGMGTHTATFEKNPGAIRWTIDFMQAEGLSIINVDFTWASTYYRISAPSDIQDDLEVDLTYDAATETMDAYLHYKS